MTEQGPFRPQPDGSLAKNEYAWNKVANYLFIEQPVGVGFSYSTTKSDYKHVGDDDAAQYNYNLIRDFLERFPEYQSNDFYITAESCASPCRAPVGLRFALSFSCPPLPFRSHVPSLLHAFRASDGGHYMPTLAKYILDHNDDKLINFKGFAVGNPFTDPVFHFSPPILHGLSHLYP